MSTETALDQLKQLTETGLAAIAEASDAAALEALRVQYLGRKSELNGILRGLKDLPPELKGVVGKESNLAKKALESALKERQESLGGGDGASETDPTLPGVRPPVGHEHLLTSTSELILDVFRGLGFSIARGPDVEDDYHNFEALNIPKDHPARDMQDTFFAAEDIVLRTHTSPVQIRTMKKTPPPIRMVFPGRVYRRETPDATHSSEFHQIELLYVDHGVTMRDLKGVLTQFAQQVFGDDVDVRFRPSYFPFVEPGAEVDISCFLCKGSGCRVCKQSGWIEILGSGMVHPNVFRHVGYDPETVTGYAAGMGVERIAMLRHGIPDIRLFFENDLRFLFQF
ncbi:MAG: phenylalanine--tRNA ligase subunit alpha [Candidatus Eisenbacteria bacterium]|uniref:Phenylalanine--tRNA ligase alpha subunit n=1 Tax=Eiseniibacteriota bacterium TaxID=2212470 RepID=A0A7Y2H3K7_UNCEI|nr:phenylalanine--tRNA ligase subunit alpha [Candidatus Eisenbacteria bacterium]